MDIYVIIIADTHINPPETLVFANRTQALTIAQECAEEQAKAYGTVVEVHTEHDAEYYPDVIYSAMCCEDPSSYVWVLVRKLDADDTFRM